MVKIAQYCLFGFIALLVAGLLWWKIPNPQDSPEVIRDRFISYATKLNSVRRLEIAQLQQMEIFERKSQAKLWGTQLKLPDVVIRASIPVEYDYFVDLGQRWEFRQENNRVVVIAPALHPGTPAANVSEMTFEVAKGSLFRDNRKVAQSLQSEITELLKQRSQDHVHLVREVARKELESIVKTWMKLENKDWHVQVVFADENSPTPNPYSRDRSF